MSVNTRLIRKRIKSSQNIAQITKAMEMVAASKVKKAQQQVLDGKPYTERIYEMVGNVTRRVDPELHPLLRKFDKLQDLRFLIVLVTTNKGLCGSLNTGLILALDTWIKTQQEKAVTKTIDFITIGKKGQRFVLRKGIHYIADFSETVPFINVISPLASLISEKFLNWEYDMVWVAFNEFISALKQEPHIKRILPISPETEPEIFNQMAQTKEESFHYLIEPEPQEVLEFVLPLYLQVQIRNAILEAEASEHSARMIAMKNATDNALALIDGLTLEYNKARQQAITYEIADIETARLSIAKRKN
ncbi:ATP synthase F1 subunit gamma [bacterium CG1_02_42_9]|nr:MAG: ATP synthase F1 subunit gamma [bacterium CG1_02_42_9]